jgi:toxin CcdB
MAQFDVHKNPGQQREAIPYVVVVQSAIFDGYRRRVVVPLVKKSKLPKVDRTRLNPTFTVKGVAVVLHPFDIVSVPVEKLGKPVTSLARHGGEIVEALDELFTRAYD